MCSSDLDSSTEGAKTNAGAISLAVGVAPGTALAIPGSLAINRNAPGAKDSSTEATTSQLKGSALTGLKATATESTDVGAYAGSLGLAANPLTPTASSTASSSVAATFGFSVAINDLDVATSAELSASDLTTTAAAPIAIEAGRTDLQLQTVSLSAAGSMAEATAGSALGA